MSTVARDATTDAYFETYGPIVCGTLVSSFLLGVITVGNLGPTAAHWSSLRKDSAWIKAFVLVLLGLNWTTSIIDYSRVVKLVAIHAGNLGYADALNERWEDRAGTVMTYITSTYCQAFLTYRVVKFSRAMSLSHGRQRRIAGGAMTAFLLAMLLITAVSSIGGSSSLSKVATYSDISADADSRPVKVFNILCEISLASAVLLDLTITVLFTIELRNGRSGFGGTNRVLGVLQSVLVQNAALATTTQIIQMVLFFAPPRIKSWFPLETLLIDKIYTLTVIALLVRPRLAHQRYHDEAADSAGIALSSTPGVLGSKGELGSLASSAAPGTPLAVTIVRSPAGGELNFMEALAELDEGKGEV